MTRPEAKGWCPGAWRPMMSGDGLVVRVRPRLARLTADQAQGLCASARRHGNGIVDLTSRANLQLRGVLEESHRALLDELAALGLLDADPLLETRRNILVPPLWREGDDSARIAEELAARLGELPDLPAKFGFAVDAGPAPVLSDSSADIRVERGASGGLLLRADGVETGIDVAAKEAAGAMIGLARWFAETGGARSRRMATHLQDHALPGRAPGEARPAPVGEGVAPGQTPAGPAYGAPFGQIDSAALSRLLDGSGAAALRVTPWRVFILEGGRPASAPEFVTAPGDPLMKADACPGAPLCASASVETRALARRLAPHVSGRLHVSGCAKGCARARPADVTLTGREGRFDVVLGGHSWDAPQESGLDARAVLRRFGAS